jgi:hypothetical protein
MQLFWFHGSLKIDQDITEILLKVALNTITLTVTNTVNYMYVLENQIKIPEI